MFRLFLIVALSTGAFGAVRPGVPMLDGRIVGGTPANINDHPYQVSLLFDGSGTGVYTHNCGGSIISRDRILTTAYCTDGTKAVQWRARAGSSFHNSSGQVIQVGSFVQHPQFNNQFDYDIAIMKLKNQLTLGVGVAAITLPAQGASVADGAKALVTGWGSLDESSESLSHQLNAVIIPTLNQEECVNAYADYNPVTTNMICAGRLGVGGQGACDGDTGGPMVVSGILVGVTSWGKGCARENYPLVFTRVAMFRNWINQNM